MQAENTNSQIQDQILPDHIIFELILPRLPVKPLLRFKSVCKFWLSTISSLEFTITHKKFYTPPTQYLLFSPYRVREQRFMSLLIDDFSHVQKFVNLDFAYDGGNICVVGSCHGLVCVYDKDNKLFCLWNPATRQYYYNEGPNYDCDNVVLAVGFGYVSSIDDYRIVCLLSCKEDDNVDVYIFSSRSKIWERMASLEKIHRYIADRADASVLIDDTLYWAPKLRHGRLNHVVGVNLVNGNLTKIQLPKLYVDSTPIEAKLYKMKGRLSLCTIKLQVMADVWMLKRNEVEWMMLFYVPLRKMELLYLTEMGKCLIRNDSQKVMLLDPSEIFIGQFHEGTFFHGYIADPLEYKESLVFPVGIGCM